MGYPGYQLRDRRQSMDRPVWNNTHEMAFTQRIDFPNCEELAAMINYALYIKGVSHRVARRTYESWEWRGYPVWLRVCLEPIWEVVLEIKANTLQYSLTYDRNGYPILKKILPLAERWRNVELIKECCKR